MAAWSVSGRVEPGSPLCETEQRPHAASNGDLSIGHEEEK